MIDYKGKKFSKEQIIFVSEVILTGAFGMIYDCLPSSSLLFEDENSYFNGALESAGMSLGILYAQLTDDGLGVHDALFCADDFYNKCVVLRDMAWKDGGKKVLDKQKEMKGSFYRIKEDIYD